MTVASSGVLKVGGVYVDALGLISDPAGEAAPLNPVGAESSDGHDVAFLACAAQSDEELADLAVRDRVGIARQAAVVEANDEDVAGGKPFR